MLYYFHRESGNYGPRDEMTDDTEWTFIIPTSHWTDEMWDLIVECSNDDREYYATHFSMAIHKGYDESGVCDECHLTSDELGREITNKNESESMYEMERE
jgi:hypothetical protein